MSNTNNQRGNRGFVTERINSDQEGRRAISQAELYLLAGKIVRHRTRRGHNPQAIANSLGMTIVECLCALQYAESSPALILRALVDEWPWKKIKQHLGRQPDSGQTVACKL
jgi:hypothetical protein